MPPPLKITAILDALGYFKTAESMTSVNTKIGESALKMGADVKISGEQQIATLIKVRQAQEATLVGMQKAAAGLSGRDLLTAQTAIAAQQGKINRSLGESTVAFSKTSEATKTGERDLGKFTRGALAGSGAASSLGRSLAFASTGFIAIAGGATLITASIKAAEEFAKTQRQADQQLKTSGKTWDQYGGQIQKTDLKLSHISGFTNQELLNSFTFLLRASKSVTESLNLNAVAADLARGRGITLQAASIALGKALGGSASALKRLGVPIPATLKGMQAIEFVARRYAGQAAVGATVSDHFRASLANFEVTIGTALLPTFDRLVTELSHWADKTVRSGKLQDDLNHYISLGGKFFHLLEGAIHGVDFVTGSFANTLVLVAEGWAGLKIVSWIGSLDKLAAAWFGVGTAATAAKDAEIAAAGTSLLPAAAGTATGIGAGVAGAGIGAGLAGLFKRLIGRGGTSDVVKRVSMYTGEGAVATEGGLALSATGVGALAVAAVLAAKELTQLAVTTGDKLGAGSGYDRTLNAISGFFTGGIGGNAAFAPQHAIFGAILHGHAPFAQALQNTFDPPTKAEIARAKRLREQALAAQAEIVRQLQEAARTHDFVPQVFLPGGKLGRAVQPAPPAPQQPLFGGAQRQQQYTQKLPPIPFAIQLAQAQAALTKSMTDDVAAAVALIKFIQKKMDEGVLHGQALIQGLQAIAGAQATIQQAQAAALAKRQAAAAAALAAASTYNVPGYLQLAQAKAEAYGRSETAILKKIIAAAEKAIAAGGKNWQGLVAAYGVIAQARQQLASDAQAAIIPLKLQLALARAQALGHDQTAILEKMKRALERALKAAKGNIQRQIDIYNQITSINQQLQSGDQSFLGLFKQASTKALTSNLNLTNAQRRVLRARLSQLGPGGTTPGTGTGAFGYAIDPTTGRPDARHPHHRRRHVSSGSVATPDGGVVTVQPRIDLNVYIDGQHVEAVVTKRQQRRAQHNPNQRRGPQAGR